MDLLSRTERNEMILNSNHFVKAGTPYPAVKELLKPFMEIFKEHEITLKESHEDEMQTQSGESLIAFKRVSALVNFPIDEEMTYQIGFVYALDLLTPLVKVFSGVNVRVCNNLCIFSNSMYKKENFNNRERSFSDAIGYLKNIEKNMESAKNIIYQMKNFFINEQEKNMLLGKILQAVVAPKNLAGTQSVINAAKLFNDPKNARYYFKENTNAWVFYNALTEGYEGKVHLLDQPEKVLQLFELMQKYCLDFRQEQRLMLAS